MNLIFATIYFSIGRSEFQGVVAITKIQIFKEMFFFSTETYTTVGYGRVNPIGDTANSVAAIESMLGFLSFAVATGLLYGRFSKPKAFLFFSKNALISPYQGGRAFMFRFASYKDNHTLTNVEIKVNVALPEESRGESTAHSPAPTSRPVRDTISHSSPSRFSSCESCWLTRAKTLWVWLCIRNRLGCIDLAPQFNFFLCSAPRYESNEGNGKMGRREQFPLQEQAVSQGFRPGAVGACRDAMRNC